MKVICPKCQFENQADSTRVVCIRCATIIEVRLDQGSGQENNGRRQTTRLPFAANPGNSQPSNPSSSGGQPSNPPRDVYATRIGDDLDDVLDIPRPTPTNYQTTYDASPVFDDVFATPGYDSSTSFDFSSVEKKPTTPIDSFQSGMPRQRETQDYIAAPEPEFMGWPVLPENSIEEEEPANNFTSGRGGLLARIVLMAVVFGGLVFGAYYFLGDFISKRKEQAEPLIGAAKSPDNNLPGATAPNGATNDVKTVEPPKISNPTPVIEPKPAQAPGQAKDAVNQTNQNIAANPVKKDESKKLDIRVLPPEGKTGRVDPPKPAPQPAARAKGNWMVQVASFNSAAQANERVSSLRAKGVEGRVVQADLGSKGTWYRVQIGGYETREAATSFGNQLKAKGAVQDFIVTASGK